MKCPKCMHCQYLEAAVNKTVSRTAIKMNVNLVKPKN